MREFLTILILFTLALSGCQEASRDSASSLDTDIKASDIAPKHDYDRKTNLNVEMFVTLFQIPRSQYPDFLVQLDKAQQLKFDYFDEGAFVSNGLITAGGDKLIWNILAKYFSDTDVIAIDKINLRILEGLAEDVEFAEIEKQSNIFYIGTNNAISAAGFVPGQIALRLRAEPLIGLRQATKLVVQTVYKPDSNSQSSEFIFRPVGFSLRLRPGQFFILGPGNIEDKEFYLVDKAYLTESPIPVVKFFVITCNLITE